jgi:hypothetical protein
VTVDSYGRCLHNREEGQHAHDDGDGAASKIALLRRYKFAIAFENSPRIDYTTEKFTQALIAGAVPITLGPPNIQDFAPHPDAFLAAEAYSTPAELAQAILEIASDKKQWAHMAASWRDVPLLEHEDPQDAELPTEPHVLYRQFAASVSLNAVHSDCRRCIWVADAYRLRHSMEGEGGQDQDATAAAAMFAAQDEYLGQPLQQQQQQHHEGEVCEWVAVRERGAYRFVRVKIPRDDSMTTVEQLQHRAISAMRAYPQATADGGPLDEKVQPAMIYTLWGREVLSSAAAVASLACGTELELVLVPPPPQ